MRGSTGALGVFGGIIRLRSSQGRQFGSLEAGLSEAGLSEHVTTGARREHRSGRPAGTKPTRAAALAALRISSIDAPRWRLPEVCDRCKHGVLAGSK